MDSVGDANLTAVLLHDPGANRQAEPGGIATPAKARLEDMFNVVRANAAAGVREFDDHLVLTPCGTKFGPQRNRDAAAGRRVPNRIRNQVESYLLKRALIAHNRILTVINETIQ
jgi:hypothetical protein